MRIWASISAGVCMCLTFEFLELAFFGGQLNICCGLKFLQHEELNMTCPKCDRPLKNFMTFSVFCEILATKCGMRAII